MDIDAWYADLKILAKRKGYEYLIADKESHREGYEEGNTPDEELDEQIWAAQASM